MVWLPLSIDLRKTYIGHAEVVWWSNLFWWAEHTLSHLANPFHNDLVFYPLGMDIVDSIFPIFVFAPVTHIFGSVVSYNLYVLSTFFLAAYGMYILSAHIHENKYVAFISGLIFAFFPFHFGASLGHLHTFSIMWIPFFVYFFLRMYEKPSYSNIFFAGLFFAINALTSWSIAVMMTIFCMVFVISYRERTFSEQFLSRLWIFILVAICFTLPGLILIVKNIVTNENMLQPLGSFITFSADIFAFFLPSPFHPILGRFSEQFYSQFTGNLSENVVSVGYSVALLALIGILAYRKEKLNRFALVSLIIFFILSLGPVLHILGQIHFTEAGLTVMLPGILTKYIPVLNMIRVPSRYDIMVMFCISIIGGYGSKYLFDRITRTNKEKIALCCLISCIILFEFISVIPAQDVKETPDFYHTIAENNSGSIIEIPIIRSPLDSPHGPIMIYYYEYQKTHGHPVLGGYFNRVNTVYEDFILKEPVLKPFFTAPSQDILKDPSFNPGYLNYNYNVSYIIIHQDFLTDDQTKSFTDYLGDDYIIDDSVDSDRLIIYSVKNLSSKENSAAPVRMELGEGWYGLENWDNASSRWISNNATLEVEASKGCACDLSLSAVSFNRPRRLEVYVNDRLEHRTTVPTGFVDLQIPLQLQNGKNIIRFYVMEGTDKPSISENGDPRDLSLAFQNISIVENYN
jgi:hypothetical protein